MAHLHSDVQTFDVQRHPNASRVLPERSNPRCFLPCFFCCAQCRAPTILPSASMETVAPADEVVIRYPRGFRARRGLNWVVLGGMYASFYMLPYNFRWAAPGMEKEFGFNHASIASILSAWAIAYGTGQLINGLFCDRIGGRASMIIGGIGTSGVNLVFGFASFGGRLFTFAFICRWHSLRRRPRKHEGIFPDDFSSSPGLVLRHRLCLHRRGPAQLRSAFRPLLRPIPPHRSCGPAGVHHVDSEHRAAHRRGGLVRFRGYLRPNISPAPFACGAGPFFYARGGLRRGF